MAGVPRPAAPLPPPPDGEIEALWTPQQLAAHLQVSVRHLYRLTRERHLPALRVGNRLRYRPDDIRLWLTERHRPVVR